MNTPSVVAKGSIALPHCPRKADIVDVRIEPISIHLRRGSFGPLSPKYDIQRVRFSAVWSRGRVEELTVITSAGLVFAAQLRRVVGL